MKKLLLGLTLLVIILIAALCKPVDTTNEKILSQKEGTKMLAK